MLMQTNLFKTTFKQAPQYQAFSSMGSMLKSFHSFTWYCMLSLQQAEGTLKQQGTS